MTTQTQTLTSTAHVRLVTPERIDLGCWYSGRPAAARNFVIELDARPLAFLIGEAARGNRVYEFLSIRRPGDILNYLWVRLIDAEDEVIRFIERQMRSLSEDFAVRGLPLRDLDVYLQLLNDEAEPFEVVWARHRSGTSWKSRSSELLSIVQSAQDQLRQGEDFLLQREIQQFDEKKHRRDFMAGIERLPLLEDPGYARDQVPELLFETIQNLIGRDDIRSVSCPFRDFNLWKMLVAEQLRRTAATGLPPQFAFGLFCPDSGLDGIPFEDWGGDVHISLEGVCGSDLFILPDWHRFSLERLTEMGRLSAAVGGKKCNHLLLRGDHGEYPGVSRRVIGEWVLYSSNHPLLDCNPFL
jgi:hypothetical protein